MITLEWNNIKSESDNLENMIRTYNKQKEELRKDYDEKMNIFIMPWNESSMYAASLANQILIRFLSRYSS